MCTGWPAAGAVAATALSLGVVLVAEPVSLPPAAASSSRPVVLWSPPSGAQTASDLQQVIDARGVVTDAWTVDSGASSRVLAARLGAGGWSKPQVVIDAPAGDPYLTVSMVVGPADEVVIAAGAEGDAGVRFSAARFSAGAWSPATTLGDYPDTDSKVRHVYGLSSIANSTGVSVLWQIQPNDSHATTFVARGLPSTAAEWTPPTVLDDAATGAFALVRDGVSTIRAAWQHGPDVVSVQGSTIGWGARQILGPSGDVRTTPHAYLATSASADLDGTVLVTWAQPDYQDVGFTCPSTLAALHTSSGWAGAVVLPTLTINIFCLQDVIPFVGQGMSPTVVGQNGDRWGDDVVATIWDGSAWGPVHQTEGRPSTAGSTVLAIDVHHSFDPPGPDQDVQWLTSSTLSAAGWSDPQRVTDPAGGWVQGYEGTTAPDGSFVVVYGKRRPWRSVAIWTMSYADGAWTKARVVAPPVKAKKRSSGAWLSAPVVGRGGRVTASWILDGRVLASSW